MTIIKTYWIDERGRHGDLEEKVGRIGDDVRRFALHSLGWIRVQELGSCREIEFDPRAARPDAIAALVLLVRRLARGPSRSLVRVRAYTGTAWIAESSAGYPADRLVDWIRATAGFGHRPEIPPTIDAHDLPDGALLVDPDPVLRAVIEIWRNAAGRLDLSATSPWVTMPWGGPRLRSNIKVLARNPGGEIAILVYQPSLTPLWGADTIDGFVSAPVLSCVPDRGLAHRVVRSAIRTLVSAKPRAECFAGPCLRSDGSVEDIKWIRISLPMASMAGGDMDSLVVFCRRLSVDEQDRWYGRR